MKKISLFAFFISCFVASIGSSGTIYIDDPFAPILENFREYGVMELPSGEFGYCRDIFGNDSEISEKDLENICRVYAETRETEDLNCRSKRIKGTETKDAIRELRNICNSLAHRAAYKAVQSYKRKRSFKNFFK